MTKLFLSILVFTFFSCEGASDEKAPKTPKAIGTKSTKPAILSGCYEVFFVKFWKPLPENFARYLGSP